MHVCPAANSCVWKILSVAMAKRQQSLLETFQKQKSARVDEECSVSESHRSEECSNSEFYGSNVILICLKLLTQIQERELLPVIKQLVKLLFHAHRVVSC